MGELIKQAEIAYREGLCPPLPPNHDVPCLEPAAISEKYMGDFRIGPHRTFARKNWTEKDWRMYSWIYSRLTERVDQEVGIILTALCEAKLQQCTLIIFTSDHGEMNAAHKLGQKSVLYEEAIRVPLIVSLPGVVSQGKVDSTHLVSNGLDLLPTIRDFAGVDASGGALDGSSLRSLLEGGGMKGWRDFLVVESHHDRMVRSESFKYCRYTSGARCEQLTGLENDPGEMNNLAELAAYNSTLIAHRDLLNRWMARTSDYNV